MKSAAAHISGLFGADAVYEALRRAEWVRREEGDHAARRHIGAAILLCRHRGLATSTSSAKVLP